jgi:membrane protease YdiL (CAAX protease family)
MNDEDLNLLGAPDERRDPEAKAASDRAAPEVEKSLRPSETEPLAANTGDDQLLTMAELPVGGSAPVGPLFGSVVLPQPPPRWRGRDFVFFVGFTLCWLLLSQFLSLAVYAILMPVMGWHTSPAALSENAVFAVAAQIVFYGPVLLYVYLLVKVRYRQPFWEGLHWRWPGGRRALRLVLGGIVLAVGLALAASLAPEAKSFPLEKLFSSPLSAYVLGAFAVTVAPFMEELIFRGVLFAFFERGLGIRFAVIATALLFAAMHVPEYWGAWTHVAMILVVGLVFSLARGVTGSLTPSVILHAAYNGTLMTGLYLGTRHFHNMQALLAGR